MKILALALLVSPVLFPSAAKANEEVKHLFTAKLLLARFEQLELTETQRNLFDKISQKLTTEVAAIRKSSGISKDDIKKRDEAYGPAKKELQGEALWERVQQETGFSDQQIAGFRKTLVLARDFREEALAILTSEQKREFPKTRKRKKD
ncbi:MAG: hypothetical protein AAGJ79_14845 [Verrucomicrobiota bacterium]